MWSDSPLQPNWAGTTLVAALAATATAGEHGCAEGASRRAENHEDDCHDHDRQHEGRGEAFRGVQIVHDLSAGFLGVRIWVLRDGLLHLLGKDRAQFLAIFGEDEDPPDGRGKEPDSSGERADTHSHARSNDETRNALLIQPNRQRTCTKHPETAAQAQFRHARETGGDEAGEQGTLGGEFPLNCIRLIGWRRGWPGGRRDVRGGRGVFFRYGDANLRSAAVRTKREGLVDGGLTLVAEVVHEGEGTVSSFKFQVSTFE